MKKWLWIFLFLSILFNVGLYTIQQLIYWNGCVDGAVKMYFKTDRNNKAIEEVTEWCSRR